ncbi:hypothetical protein V8F06_005663 [Rhypophila decipiens]
MHHSFETANVVSTGDHPSPTIDRMSASELTAITAENRGQIYRYMMAVQSNPSGVGYQSATALLVARKTITRPGFTSIITITPTPVPPPTTTTLSVITTYTTTDTTTDTNTDTTTDTTIDTAVTSITTITVTKHPSTRSTARPSLTIDGPPHPTATSTEPVISTTSSQPATATSISTIQTPRPSSTPPSETPEPTRRPKTVVIISSACALLLVIGLALTGWYVVRRRRRRCHLQSHNKPSSSRSNSEQLPGRSELYGLEYRVSPKNGRQRHKGVQGNLIPHSRGTLPSEPPSERWSKPFMENLQHILGGANPFDSDSEDEAMYRVRTGGPGML